MEMLLMALTLSLFGLAVSAVMFGAATRSARAEDVADAREPSLAPSEFFAEEDRLESPPISVESLLAQIEHHVRAEQFAAESFAETPTLEALRVRSSSPLVH